jgi:hypothetical protein
VIAGLATAWGGALQAAQLGSAGMQTALAAVTSEAGLATAAVGGIAGAALAAAYGLRKALDAAYDAAGIGTEKGTSGLESWTKYGGLLDEESTAEHQARVQAVMKARAAGYRPNDDAAQNVFERKTINGERETSEQYTARVGKLAETSAPNPFAPASPRGASGSWETASSAGQSSGETSPLSNDTLTWNQISDSQRQERARRSDLRVAVEGARAAKTPEAKQAAIQRIRSAGGNPDRAWDESVPTSAAAATIPTSAATPVLTSPALSAEQGATGPLATATPAPTVNNVDSSTTNISLSATTADQRQLLNQVQQMIRDALAQNERSKQQRTLANLTGIG